MKAKRRAGSIHMENGRLTVGTLVNNGTFAMDYNSTLTFGSFTNAGTFSISLDGYCGGEKKLLLDYTGSETLTGEYYSKLLGSSWNDACFTVENNDLYLNYDSAVVVYVNSTYSEENCGGHTWGVDAFADHESAMAKNPVRVVSCGGEFSSTVALNSKEGQIDGGTYKPLLAGHLVNTDVKNWDDHEGHLTVRINDGTFTSNVIGADGVAGGSSERTGNVSMTIDGGTFRKQVAGGMYLAHTDSRGSVILTGDIDLTISGGTFDGRIYGGNFGINDTVSGRMSMKGNINLTIDANKALTINEHISAGSRGRGTVDGNGHRHRYRQRRQPDLRRTPLRRLQRRPLPHDQRRSRGRYKCLGRPETGVRRLQQRVRRHGLHVRKHSLCGRLRPLNSRIRR